MPPKRRTLESRIWSKVDRKGEAECWPWTAAKTSAGYGHLLADEERNGKRTTVLAHRAVYQLLVGPIPEDAVLDHTCHGADASCPGNSGCAHRACVNPAHLEPVSFGENCMRGVGIAPRNAEKTHCHNGHEYTPENTRIDKFGRNCKQCTRERFLRWKAKNPDYERPARNRKTSP